MAAATQEKKDYIRLVAGAHEDIFKGDECLLQEILKGEETTRPSNQQGNPGTKERLINYEQVQKIREYNPYHVACLEAKKSATIGLGFETELQKRLRINRLRAKAGLPPEDIDSALLESEDLSKVETELDSKCQESFLTTMDPVIENMQELGTGYLEVVRVGKDIDSLYFLPANDIHVVTEENDRHKIHYQVKSDVAGDSLFPCFGDKEDFINRRNYTDSPDTLSEIIEFRDVSSRSKYYGFPSWLASVPVVELFKGNIQFLYDFFLNRCRPDFLVFFKNVADEESVTKFKAALQLLLGSGNQHKTVVADLKGEDAEADVHNISKDDFDGDFFTRLTETLSLAIVSGHQVPPLLAGIQIPGKLGASNELVNALIGFQKLVIGQYQKSIQTVLANTLGKDPSIDLSPVDFRLNTILDEFDLDKAETVSQMREPLGEAQMNGRDINAGLRQ